MSMIDEWQSMAAAADVPLGASIGGEDFNIGKTLPAPAPRLYLCRFWELDQKIFADSESSRWEDSTSEQICAL